MSFQNLKRNRDQISKLVSAAESVGGSTETKSYVDERVWKLFWQLGHQHGMYDIHFDNENPYLAVIIAIFFGSGFSNDSEISSAFFAHLCIPS